MSRLPWRHIFAHGTWHHNVVRARTGRGAVGGRGGRCGGVWGGLTGEAGGDLAMLCLIEHVNGRATPPERDRDGETWSVNQQDSVPRRAEPTCRLSRPRPLCTAPGGDCVVTDSSHHSVARCRCNRIFVAHLPSLSLSLPCAKNNHTRRQTRSSLFCRDGFLYFW